MTDERELEVVRRKATRMREARRRGPPVWRYLSQIGSLGWQLVVPVVLGALGGRLLAKLTDRPALALGPLLAGVAVGCYLVYRQIRRSLEEDRP